MQANQFFLAFDYGKTQIGVAVGQLTSGTASPLAIIKAKDGQPNWQEIEDVIAEWKVKRIVIGWPLNMDGSESEMCVACKKFGQRVHGRFGVQVNYHDERLTSRSVKSDLVEMYRDGGKNLSLDKVDSVCAAVILQEWLSMQSDQQ